MDKDTITFTELDGRFTFTVKDTFLAACLKKDKKFKGPDKYNVYVLTVEHNLHTYLHNSVGSAIIDKKENKEYFWINGKEIDKEQAEKIIHNNQFTDKLNNILK